MYLASKAELNLTYDKIKFVDKIKDKVSTVLRNRESFQSITISGRDQKNLGMFFNNNLFTRKILFKSEIDENGMFSTKKIFEKLILEITNEVKKWKE